MGRGLKATCGAIVPEKSFWYLVHFQWTVGSSSYNASQTAPAQSLSTILMAIEKNSGDASYSMLRRRKGFM
jgi:hypothetical protein